MSVSVSWNAACTDNSHGSTSLARPGHWRRPVVLLAVEVGYQLISCRDVALCRHRLHSYCTAPQIDRASSRTQPYLYTEFGANPSTGTSGQMVKYNLFIYIILITHLLVRPINGFSRVMAQTMRTDERVCLLGDC